MGTVEVSTHSAEAAVRAILLSCFGEVAAVRPAGRTRNPAFRFELGGRRRVLKLVPAGDDSVTKEVTLIALVRSRGVPAPVVERFDARGEVCGVPFLIMESAGDETLAERRAAAPGAASPALEALYREMGTHLATIHGIELPGEGEIAGAHWCPQIPRLS